MSDYSFSRNVAYHIHKTDTMINKRQLNMCLNNSNTHLKDLAQCTQTNKQVHQQLTSFSESFLTQMQAARLRKPSSS